jgi:DNA-binding NarL/FixJ family response regulator
MLQLVEHLDSAQCGGSAPRLTQREAEVLGCLLRGASEKEVASDLAISQHTVHSHVKSIYKAHRVSSRAALLVLCLSAARA